MCDSACVAAFAIRRRARYLLALARRYIRRSRLHTLRNSATVTTSSHRLPVSAAVERSRAATATPALRLLTAPQLTGGHLPGLATATAAWPSPSHCSGALKGSQGQEPTTGPSVPLLSVRSACPRHQSSTRWDPRMQRSELRFLAELMLRTYSQ